MLEIKEIIKTCKITFIIITTNFTLFKIAGQFSLNERPCLLENSFTGSVSRLLKILQVRRYRDSFVDQLGDYFRDIDGVGFLVVLL